MASVLYLDDLEAIKQYLVIHPEDINQFDPLFATPLYAACAQNRNDVVDFLIESGADLDIQCTFGNETALIVAAHKGFVDIVIKLLAAGANASFVNDDGETPLMAAADNGHFDIVKILTPCSNIYAKDGDGWTAINHAICGNHIEIVKYFLDLGLNINHIDHDSNSYLHQAVKYDNYEVAVLLRNFEIDNNLENCDGKSARELATSSTMMELLCG